MREERGGRGWKGKKKTPKDKEIRRPQIYKKGRRLMNGRQGAQILLSKQQTFEPGVQWCFEFL